MSETSDIMRVAAGNVCCVINVCPTALVYPLGCIPSRPK